MTHPVLQGMLMMGCQSQQKVLLAFHTYMELCEVKILWDVDYEYDKELDTIYLKAKNSKNAEQDIYIPISVSTEITPSWIDEVQRALSKKHSTSSFILVIKERDSSSVYYKVSQGVIRPPSPESAKKRKAEEEKRKLMEKELRLSRFELFKKAKMLATNKINENPESGDNENPTIVDSNKEDTNNKEASKDSDKAAESSPIIEILDDPVEIIEL